MRTREFKAIQKKMVDALQGEYDEVRQFANTYIRGILDANSDEELAEVFQAMEEDDFWIQPTLASRFSEIHFTLKEKLNPKLRKDN